MALRDYLVGEIVEDVADGLLTRREALRRLTLLGLTAAGAGAVLAACASDGDDDEDGRGGTSTTAAEAAGPDAGQTIRFEGESGELQAAYAAPRGDPKAGLLVIHENRGLTPHFFTLVARLAGEGYAALCPDLVSAEGGSAKIGEAETGAALGRASDDRLLGDLRASLDELERRAPEVKLGAVGFCFGGGMAWKLLDAAEIRLAAVVPFYGPAPAEPDFRGAVAAVLGIYAELDARVNESRERARAALEAAGLTYEIRTFAGADHAFFNDTGARYDETAAGEANQAMLAWFDKYLT